MRVPHHSLLQAVLLVGFAIIVGAMLVPYSVVHYALSHFAYLKQLENFVDTVAPGFEMNHLLAFGVAGFAAHFGWRKRRVWHVAAGCAVVAALVEVAQIWIPGREASVLHAILDVVGGVGGFGLAWLSMYTWGTDGFHVGYKHPIHHAGERADR